MKTDRTSVLIPLSRPDGATARLCMVAGLASAIALIGMAAVSAQAPARADVDSMRAKVAIVTEAATCPCEPARQPVRTSMSEREINAYLSVDGPSFLPAGLTSPVLRLGDQGRVVASGIVDLDKVRLSRPRDWLDPLGYMTGSVALTATGVVIGSDGEGVVSFESAMLAGVSVPKQVAQELLRYYSTTPEVPKGIVFGEPFDLPANIDSIVVGTERATIVQ